MFKDYIINESTEFSTLENNPLIYSLIIPKLIINDDIKIIKEDMVLKNAVDAVEKFIHTLSKNTVKLLKDSFKPYAMMDLFKLSKNYKATFDNYILDFKNIICNEETNFIKCMELNKKIDTLYNSPELITYRNTL